MWFPRHQSILDFFRTQVSERPDAVALKEGKDFLTYRDLDRLSNRVANGLLAKGIRNEEIVALLIDKSFHFVIAALGVMKAGGSYIPMDPRVPDQRIGFTLSDSGARFLLVWEEFVPRCAGYGKSVIVVDEKLSSFALDSEKDPALASDPARRAYIIYTSGSTGKPKGVEIEHHSLTNLISVYHNSFGMTPQDRVTLTANVAFDVSVGDLWPVLAAGATVLIPPKDLFDRLEVHRVVSWVDGERASIAFMPTALMPLLMEAQWPVHLRLRFMITGGDTLRCRPKKHHRFKVINGYGPTENTVWSTFSVVTPDGTGMPPIGRAIGNVSTYILDATLQPVAPGEAGELYLGGEQVARGYFNREELTAENDREGDEGKLNVTAFHDLLGRFTAHRAPWQEPLRPQHRNRAASTAAAD
jgi:amino acid adenylation domain-containing protein